MDSGKTKRTLKKLFVHASVAVRGFLRATYGTMVVSMIAIAIYGLFSVGGEGGWCAVCEFVASLAVLVVALVGVYAMGGRKVEEKNV